MTRTTIALLTAAAMVFGSAVTVAAQAKKGPTPKTHVTSTKTTKVSSPKTTTAPKMQTSGPKKATVSTTSKAPKTTTVKATKPAKTTSSAKSAKANTKTTTKLAKTDTKSARVDAKAAKADAKKTANAAKADSKTARTETTDKKTTTTTATTTTGEGDDAPVTLTKVQEKLQKNTKLAEKLESRLPAGTDLMEASDGFRNLGQFVAAVNVSNNLGLDFEKLKTAMVDDGKSLGQAIQYVKSDVESPTMVATRAETDAQRLITETERQPTTTTSTTPTKTKSKDKPKRTLRTQSGS